MNCKITATPDFAQELKQLHKRYSSMKEDYKTFLKELRENPFMGTPLGKKLRKVRFAIASKGKGRAVVPGLLPIRLSFQQMVSILH